MPEKYTIEIWYAPDLTSTSELLRTHTSTTADGAEVMVESLRDSYGQRESVTWEGEEVDEEGLLYGRSAAGERYMILVTPPLKVTS